MPSIVEINFGIDISTLIDSGTTTEMDRNVEKPPWGSKTSPELICDIYSSHIVIIGINSVGSRLPI